MQARILASHIYISYIWFWFDEAYRITNPLQIASLLFLSKKQREKKWKGQGIFTLHFILFAFIAFVDTKQKEYLSPIQNQKARKKNKILSKTWVTSDGLSNKLYIIDACVIVLIIQKLIFTCFVLYLSYFYSTKIL